MVNVIDQFTISSFNDISFTCIQSSWKSCVRWGAGFFGPSVAGMGLGGYAGVGWKGYKLNWTLQESIVTGAMGLK